MASVKTQIAKAHCAIAELYLTDLWYGTVLNARFSLSSLHCCYCSQLRRRRRGTMRTQHRRSLGSGPAQSRRCAGLSQSAAESGASHRCVQGHGQVSSLYSAPLPSPNPTHHLALCTAWQSAFWRHGKFTARLGCHRHHRQRLTIVFHTAHVDG